MHEWGTFTSLQDENGDAIGGINTDDEPVPSFVHSLSRWLLIKPTEAPPSFFQGAPRCHPDVTMRLETPVIYFYPSKDFEGSVDVGVQFQGGWLTEFFPEAQAVAPGISEDKFGALTNKTIGTLRWLALALNASGEGPATNAHVWTTPRKVNSTLLQVKEEREKFLFYRGVAHCDAPLRVIRSKSDLIVRQNGSAPPKMSQYANLWLLDVRANGMAAFRSLRPSDQTSQDLAKTAATFPSAEYSEIAIGELKSQMRQDLIKAGLFAQEADALLETWALSYFKSPGLRLFFLVPPNWTEAQLPLTTSSEAQITRIMVGRIEIVTPEQRDLIAKIAAGPAPNSWIGFRDRLEAQTIRVGNSQDWNDVNDGTKTFAAIGFAVPPLYRDYLELGRFRNALILDEQKRNPHDALATFIKNFGLEGYRYQ